MPKELQPRKAAPTWDSLSPGEKQAWLLDQALDFKREILTMPLPDPDDMSPESHRTRALVLTAADSTIEQTMLIGMLAMCIVENTPKIARIAIADKIRIVIFNPSTP